MMFSMEKLPEQLQRINRRDLRLLQTQGAPKVEQEEGNDDNEKNERNSFLADDSSKSEEVALSAESQQHPTEKGSNIPEHESEIHRCKMTD